MSGDDQKDKPSKPAPPKRPVPIEKPLVDIKKGQDPKDTQKG